MEQLFNKKRTHNVDGETMYDLGIPCVNIRTLIANGLLRVSQDQKGRLDRFSQLNVSKDRSAIDILMYYNHIFNPFSVDEGDVLYTPVYSSGYFKPAGEPVLPDGKKHSTNQNGKKELSYAEKVEKAARTGLGLK